MADQALHAPTNPHFFKPLLPGFHTHLDIPVAFFRKHVEGRTEHKNIAKLRSDASDKTWIVKMEGLKFTEGWEAFAVAHDLRIGDMAVFRDEGEMVFHVTALGPSCCEIQYTSSHKIDDGNSSREKRVKRNPRKKGECSSDNSSFVANVSASSLITDRLVRLQSLLLVKFGRHESIEVCVIVGIFLQYLPCSFARSNGLDKMSGKKIVLVNEEGRSWKLDLKYEKSGMHTYVKPGWTSFCTANGMNCGHYPFKLLQKSAPPVIRLCRTDYTPKPNSKSKSEPESSSPHSCFIGSATPSSLTNDSLYLPKKFVTVNGLDKGCREVVLKNESGGRWSLVLKHFESHGLTFLKRGWISFCQVNGIKVGDSFRFKLVGTGNKPILSLRPAQSKTPLDSPRDVTSLSPELNPSSGDDENKEDSIENKSVSQECLEIEKRKYTQKQLVTLTLTPYAFRCYKLILPMGFTRVNGINKPGKITLLGQDGVKWVVDLLQDKRRRRMRLGTGWRDFCKAQGVKIGESFVLELIWEEEANPVLKFCTIVNTV